MANSFTRWRKYFTAKANHALEQRADPRVQLEQAIREAQDQHRRLRDQAASVIANRNQAEMRLNRAIGELEKVNGNARQALVMAEDAQRRGEATRSAEYTTAAEALANRMIQLETDIEDLKSLSLQSAQAADQAKAAVEQNARLLQAKLSERQKLLSQLDQARMQEEMNRAMATLSETVGEDVPTLEEVRVKIEARYAKAKGFAELQDTSVDARVREIEAASANIEAQARLAEMRQQLGLPSATPAVGELDASRSEANNEAGSASR